MLGASKVTIVSSTRLCGLTAYYQQSRIYFKTPARQSSLSSTCSEHFTKSPSPLKAYARLRLVRVLGMPLGLRNAVQTMQYSLGYLLGKLPFARVYQDDFLVFLSTIIDIYSSSSTYSMLQSSSPTEVNVRLAYETLF